MEMSAAPCPGYVTGKKEIEGTHCCLVPQVSQVPQVPRQPTSPSSFSLSEASNTCLSCDK